MTTRSLLVSAAALAVLAIGSSAATGSTEVAVKKQRIAIEGIFNLGTEKGTFKLIPLTPGPLKRDSGTFKGFGSFDPNVLVRNGQSVTLITGRDDLTGKNGTFSVSQRVELISAGGVYGANVGTWTFDRGTGVYEGLTGGGGFAGVLLPGSMLRFREEGFVRRG